MSHTAMELLVGPHEAAERHEYNISAVVGKDNNKDPGTGTGQNDMFTIHPLLHSTMINVRP